MIRTVLIVGALAAVAYAQPSNVYLFFGPGGVTCCGHTDTILHAGLGGEAVLGAGLGFGAEIGAMGVSRYFVDSGFGVFSLNGYYHFVHGRGVKVDPFVTGGYTLFFRSGHADLFNVGGGLNYWFYRRLGFRVEVRDHVLTDGEAVHYWSVRFGLAF